MAWDLCDCVLIVLVVPSMIQHPLACRVIMEVGRPFKVTCSTPADSLQNSQLMWALAYYDSDNIKQTDTRHVCLPPDTHNSTDCMSDLHPGTSITSKRSGGHVVSTLEISDITSRYRGFPVECGLRNSQGLITFENSFLQCNIFGHPYVSPVDHRCEIKQEKENMIYLTCDANVSPHFFCEINQIYKVDGERERKMVIPASDITYSGSGDRKSCSAHLYRPMRGEYEFFINMYPDVTPLRDLREMPLNMKYGDYYSYWRLRKLLSVPVGPYRTTVAHSTTNVSLEVQPSVDACLEDGVVTSSRCTAVGFTSKPVFTWTDGFGRDISRSATVELQQYNGHVAYVSTLNVSVTPRQDDQGITCTATPSDHQPVVRTDVTELGTMLVRTPPTQPPEFSTEGGSMSRTQISVLENSTVQMRCSVPGGHPEVTTTRVTCRRYEAPEEEPDSTARLMSRAATDAETSREIIMVDKEVSSSELEFQIETATGEDYKCTCSAKHVTGCYDKQTDLVIYTMQELNHAALISETNRGFNKLYWLLAITSSVMFAACIVLLIFCIKRNNNKTELYYSTPTLSGLSSMTTISGEQKCNNRVAWKPPTPLSKRRTYSENDHGYESDKNGGYLDPLTMVSSSSHLQPSTPAMDHQIEYDIPSDVESDEASVVDDHNVYSTPFDFVHDYRELVKGARAPCCSTVISKEKLSPLDLIRINSALGSPKPV